MWKIEKEPDPGRDEARFRDERCGNGLSQMLGDYGDN